METVTKSSETNAFEGSIHVDDLLNLYEKIRSIVFLKVPEFKKIEPRFEISAGDEDSKDMKAAEVERLFSPDQVLSTCSFTLRLPDPVDQQDVFSVTFTGDKRRTIRISAEGTNAKLVEELISVIIYRINPYVATMNKERQPPAMHEEYKAYTTSTKPAKPEGSLDVYEVPEIKSNLSASGKARLEKDSRKTLSIFLQGLSS